MAEALLSRGFHAGSIEDYQCNLFELTALKVMPVVIPIYEIFIPLVTS